MNTLLLTFDTEDFIGKNSLTVLKIILDGLKKHDFRALFFITGHMAERLQTYPEIIEALSKHEIGYHSSSHSVHPTIFEFSDTQNYDEAYKISLERESCHIDYLTGDIGQVGGIYLLKKIFPSKKIVSYRAPGYCWNPPHLEALRDLGIKFDFSADLMNIPVKYKDVTFYPYSKINEWNGDLSSYQLLLWSLVKNKITIADLHPHYFNNSTHWDAIYFKKNPQFLTSPAEKNTQDVQILFQRFNLMLKRLKQIEKTGLIHVCPDLQESRISLKRPKRADVLASYQLSMKWAQKYFNYRPRFILDHFFDFFEVPK